MTSALLNISWQDYLGCMFIALLIYWILVGVLYFGRTIQSFFHWSERKLHHWDEIEDDGPFTDPGDETPLVREQTVIHAQPGILEQAETHRPIKMQGQKTLYEQPSTHEAPKEDLYPQAQLLLEKVNELFKSALEQKMIKEELKQALRSLLTKEEYKTLKASSLGHSIQKAMVEQAEYYCSIQFSEEDLVMMWKV